MRPLGVSEGMWEHEDMRTWDTEQKTHKGDTQGGPPGGKRGNRGRDRGVKGHKEGKTRRHPAGKKGSYRAGIAREYRQASQRKNRRNQKGSPEETKGRKTGEIQRAQRE